MSIANILADRFTMHDVNLVRFSAGESRRIRSLLTDLQDQLTLKIEAYGDESENLTLRRMQALFKATDLTIENSYAEIASTHDDNMMSLAEVMAGKTRETINQTLNVSLLNVGVPESVLKAMVNDDISMGLPAKEWWDGQSNRLRQRFQSAIRQGVFAGENLSDLKRRVRGKRENGFKDGIMQTTSREAEALIRTSVQSIAQNARMETFKANDDVIKGVQWLSTLDLRTTTQCQALSGQAWTLDGEKLEGTELDFPGPPPIHFNCRSGLTPVIKSWGDLIRDAKGDKALAKRMDAMEEKVPKSTQANMDGKPVSSTMNYEQWLKSQSEERQIEALGEGKWELWKNGEIELTDLIDNRNRPLTLKELEAL